jgi:hypothetical protein
MDAPEMPLPPPFMWACPTCVVFLHDLADAFELAAVDQAGDSVLGTQIALARHIAVEHPGEVPAPHNDGCEICAHYEQHPEDALYWAEHRARPLFLPPDTARLM